MNESIPEPPENDPLVSEAGDPPDTPDAGQDTDTGDDCEYPGTSDDRRPSKYYPL